MWETAMRQRDASRDLLFPIRKDPLHGLYAGCLLDGRQALVECWPNGKMVMVVFDREGNLTGVVHQDLPTPRQFLELGDLDAAYEDNYEQYLWRELNVSPAMIHIKAFCLPEEELAVFELPDFLLEFQENPSNPKLTDDGRKGLAESYRLWKEHGQFVFVCYGGDYWLDGTGEVVAT
jgi:hypothetical protein